MVRAIHKLHGNRLLTRGLVQDEMVMGTTYTCTRCKTAIDTGEFMAVIGTAPADGLRAPIGRADKIMSEIGQIYCATCVQALGAEGLIAAGKKELRNSE